MSITRTETGAVVITGEADTRFFQLLQWKGALKLEILGMRHSQGSVYAHVKKQLGFKGNKQRVLAQLEAHIQRKMEERDAASNSAGQDGRSPQQG